MDGHQVFDAILGIAGFLGMFVLNNLSKTVDKLEDKVNDVPLKYVVKSDYIADVVEIKSMLREIYAELRQKEDKESR